jgi:hypothetical protein
MDLMKIMRRRSFLALSAAASAAGLAAFASRGRAQLEPAANQTLANSRAAATPITAADAESIRPFHVDVSEAALAELRRRVAIKRA